MPALESAEFAAYTAAFRAAPAIGQGAALGGATGTLVPGLGARIFNRVLGLRSTEPLDEIAAFFGDEPWWVSDSHGLGPELEQRGFRLDYGWMKFSRGIGPREARSDLEVRAVGPDRAGAFGRVVAEGYRLPEWTQPVAAGVVGRPGWSCYIAYDGAEAAGAGALFVHDGVGWLGYAATLPEY